MANVQPIEGLYYPRIEFPSVAWVKATLLYWEVILRIVPDGHAPHDPPEVHALVQAGLIQDISPAPFRRVAADTFGRRLEDLLQSRKGKPIEDDGAAAGARKSDREGLVHLTEIEGHLARELEANHLLSAAGEWARMSPSVAHLYQITMANEAAHQLFAAPITHSGAFDAASTYFSAQKVAREAKAVPPDGLQWAQLYAPFPSLKTAGALSVKKLLDLRSRTVKWRHAFRETVQERVAAIATLPSPEAIRAHLEGLATEMEEELQTQREALRSARVRDMWTFVGISSPLSIAAATTLVGGPALMTPLGAFGSIGLKVVDWFLEQSIPRRNEGHYLLALEREVDHTKAGADLGDRMRRLTLGT